MRVIESMARVKLGRHEEIIEVWEKDPSVQAFTDLMNRALDKPAEPPQQLDIDLRVDWQEIMAILQSARKLKD